MKYVFILIMSISIAYLVSVPVSSEYILTHYEDWGDVKVGSKNITHVNQLRTPTIVTHEKLTPENTMDDSNVEIADVLYYESHNQLAVGLLVKNGDKENYRIESNHEVRIHTSNSIYIFDLVEYNVLDIEFPVELYVYENDELIETYTIKKAT